MNPPKKTLSNIRPDETIRPEDGIHGEKRPYAKPELETTAFPWTTDVREKIRKNFRNITANNTDEVMTLSKGKEEKILYEIHSKKIDTLKNLLKTIEEYTNARDEKRKNDADRAEEKLYETVGILQSNEHKLLNRRIKGMLAQGIDAAIALIEAKLLQSSDLKQLKAFRQELRSPKIFTVDQIAQNSFILLHMLNGLKMYMPKI